VLEKMLRGRVHLDEIEIRISQTEEDREIEFKIRELRRRASNGDADAQYNLGVRYLMGSRYDDAGYVPLDRRRGYEFVASAAEKGHPKALYELASIYEDGLDSSHYEQEKFVVAEKNEAKALYYYRRAAKAGSTMAMKRLAKIYRKGQLGVEKDAAQAQYWEEQADKVPSTDGVQGSDA